METIPKWAQAAIELLKERGWPAVFRPGDRYRYPIVIFDGGNLQVFEDNQEKNYVSINVGTTDEQLCIDILDAAREAELNRGEG